MNMKPIAKTLSLEEKEYYKVHIELINALLPVKLTNKEAEVLAVFMTFDGTLAQNRFCTTGKKIVREALSLSHQNLSNYINSLRAKGFINKDDQILPLLFPDKNNQTYMIKLINEKNSR